ncbi:hypothetical protein SCA6_018082 [Theobroma cacao]
MVGGVYLLQVQLAPHAHHLNPCRDAGSGTAGGAVSSLQQAVMPSGLISSNSDSHYFLFVLWCITLRVSYSPEAPKAHPSKVSIDECQTSIFRSLGMLGRRNWRLSSM